MVKLVGSPEVLDRGEGVSAYDDLRGDLRHAKAAGEEREQDQLQRSYDCVDA